jgi:CheY-like chemotaxis protein
MSEIRPFEILLAEDSPADAELVREALKEYSLNCSLRIVSDGAQAIEFIQRSAADVKSPPLDLVLLDMRLPKRNGDEVLKYLRAEERYACTPVIVMTGLSRNSIDEAAIGYEGTVYFEKPSTLEEFLQLGLLVRQLLNESTAATSDWKATGGAT